MQAELELKICYHRLSAMVLGVNITIGVIIFKTIGTDYFAMVFETTNNRLLIINKRLFHDYYNNRSND